MTRLTRLEVYDRMLRSGMVAVFNYPDPDTTFSVVEAIAAGGCRLIELTHRAYHALEVFSTVEQRCRRQLPDVVLGAGSVIDRATATAYINAGADFVVGPVLDADTARACNRRKVAYVPGCATPTEIGQAEELGCEIVKVFPGGAVGGPPFVSAVLGPSPWTLIMPTGGVDPEEASLSAWFGAGVACIGMGSRLVPRSLVDAEDWPAITARVREAQRIVDALIAERGR